MTLNLSLIIWQDEMAGAGGGGSGATRGFYWVCGRDQSHLVEKANCGRLYFFIMVIVIFQFNLLFQNLSFSLSGRRLWKPELRKDIAEVTVTLSCRWGQVRKTIQLRLGFLSFRMLVVLEPRHHVLRKLKPHGEVILRYPDR